MTGGAAKKGKTSAPVSYELFNLANDPNETTNLATKQQEKLAAMQTKLADVSKADRDAVAND